MTQNKIDQRIGGTPIDALERAQNQLDNKYYDGVRVNIAYALDQLRTLSHPMGDVAEGMYQALKLSQDALLSQDVPFQPTALLAISEALSAYEALTPNGGQK